MVSRVIISKNGNNNKQSNRMSLGTKQNKTFLNIREGKIIKKGPHGEEAYTYVEGYLGAIYTREREFKGERVPYWYIDLQEPSGGEIYSLSIPYSSGVAKSILNALASAEEMGMVKIEVYQRGEFTKATVYNKGQRLPWKYPQLPPLEEIQVGGRTVKDDSRRMEFIEQIAREVTDKINYNLI